jgi:hypothetical protein
MVTDLKGVKPATAKTVDGLRDFEHAGEQLDPTPIPTAPRHQARDHALSVCDGALTGLKATVVMMPAGINGH